MGGRNQARVKALAQKEWDRKEAMRKEREMATSKLNPNRQSTLGYNLRQVGKAPGNIAKGLIGTGKKILGIGNQSNRNTSPRRRSQSYDLPNPR